MKNKKRVLTSLTTILLAVLIFAGCAQTIQIPQKKDVPETEGKTEIQVQEDQPQEAQLSYVSIDINPSIRLTIKEGAVLYAQAFNDDGQEIIYSTDVAGLSPQEAVNVLIEAIAQQGYFDNSDAALVITACGDKDEELLEGIKDSASQALLDIGLECEVVASCVSNQTVEDAKNAGLTPGRYKLLSYIAQQEGISFEEAKQKYGALKMSDLIKMVPNPGEVFGKRGGGDDFDPSEALDGLTPEQLQMLNQAKEQFSEAMRTAQQKFVQTKKQVQTQVKTQRTAIQNEFKSSKDQAQYKQQKTALKKEYQLKRNEARRVFFAAREQAKQRFREAVGSLGLDESVISALFDCDYDLDWDNDIDWNDDDDDRDDRDDDDRDDDEDNDDERDNKEKGRGNRGNKVKDAGTDNEQ